MKRKINLNAGHFLMSLLCVGLIIALFFAPVIGAGYSLATTPAILTAEQQIMHDALLNKITEQVKSLITESQKPFADKADIENKVAALNTQIKQLTDSQMADLKQRVDALATGNADLVKELKEAKDALKNQGVELQKLKDKGASNGNENGRKTFRELLKEAILEKKDQVLKTKTDVEGGGERLSMMDYFSADQNKRTPVFTIKSPVDMLESNIVQANVATIRLTELDPNRVGIPLTIYPHVMDVFQVKTVNKPYMSLLVVYSYEDGAGTKTEGAAPNKSSFLFKTVSFKAFYISTYFTLSDETLDDLDEALDEISNVAPDKIRDSIDSKVLGASGDDASDIAGILTSGKHTVFSNPLSTSVTDAYIVDVIAAAKLQCQNNKYRPNIIYMSPEDIVLLAAKKNSFEDSKSDRRVAYNNIGDPVSVCGLAIVVSTAINEGSFIVIDNRQPWIGRRKDMTLEIGYNGTDFTEGQKTVMLKTRVAFGVRDKAGVIYVANVETAIAAISGS